MTDRCNLRCAYCMPGELFGRDFVFLRHAELLSFEEIVRVARQCIALGVRKIRLSGGEPLLRHGVERLVEMLAGLHGNDGKSIELAMTSNGTLLAKKASALKDAGLMRLNISLDALDENTFRCITGGSVSPEAVLEGIAAAESVGLTPVKVNAVVRRGVNESEIMPLVRRFRHTGIIVRFIEYMDVGKSNGWRLDDVINAGEILALIDREYPLISIDTLTHEEGVAKRWAFQDGGGEIGVITSVTQAFCHTCSRLRLSTDGKLYTCLFAADGIDLRTLIRAQPGDDAALRQRIAATWRGRADRYSQIRHEVTEALSGRIEMSYIGG
ncbi:MAG: GTP 3',8-cyclase MoaA [Betaproteobacteria bacterium]|nr:GTP 3',8-cyclase MoaA [Betaproteobacteria bacterium]